MKLNIRDFKLDPEEDAFFKLDCFQDNPLTSLLKLVNVDQYISLTCDNKFLTYRVNKLGCKILKSVPLKAITGIMLQYQRDTKFFAAFCFFLATAAALLVVGLCVNASSSGLLIMASVSLFLSLICLLIFFLSKTLFLGVQNGSSEFAITISCKPTIINGEKIGRKKFEEVVILIRERIFCSKSF